MRKGRRSPYTKTLISCAMGCDELYCSTTCRDADQFAHSLVCPMSGDAQNEFVKFCLRTSETFLIAARLISQVLSDSDSDVKTTQQRLMSLINEYNPNGINYVNAVSGKTVEEKVSSYIAHIIR